MAGIAYNLLLRICSLLPSPVIRAYKIFRACYDYYAPQTWLLLYYPFLYLAKVAKRLPVLSVGRDNEIRPNRKPGPTNGQGLCWILSQVGLEATTTISVAILDQMIYVILLRYCLLDSDFWKGTQLTHLGHLFLGKPIESEEDTPHGFAREVPDRLLHTSVEIGLSRDEVIVRQKGSLILADGRIVALDSAIYINQTGVTGQSDPVKKQLGDTCYAGTVVVRGDASLMVVATGYQTFVGSISYMIGDPMPERQSLRKVAIPRHVIEYHGVLRSIGGTVCALTLAPISVNRILGSPTRFSQQILESAVGLAIVAITISLHIIVPAYQGRGAARLRDDSGLVHGQLEAGESLAEIDIICCDKSGTITESRLTLLEPYCISCDPEDLILTACLSSSPDKQNLDLIDQAMANDVETKMMQSSIESPLGERMLCVKGAPKDLLKAYLQDHPDKEGIKESYISMLRDFASRGIRRLAIARKRENDKWELLGVAPLFDPLRPDTASAVWVANALGVSVKIYTGDAAAIAKSVTQSIGMSADILEAESIGIGEEIPTSEITARIEAADAYAEFDPVHKEKIIQALQSHGHLVAATGDGVEDVPTLGRADCGITVEGAADMVFQQNPGLSSIVGAIQISRQTFPQVHNYITYRTTLSLHLMFVMFWYFAAYTEVLDVRWLILHISDIVALALVSDNANTPFLKKPQRWSFRGLLADVMPLTIILATGSWLSLLAIADQGASTSGFASLGDFEKISSSRSQVLFLHIVLSDHWMSLLTHEWSLLGVYSKLAGSLDLVLYGSPRYVSLHRRFGRSGTQYERNGSKLGLVC